MKVASKKRIGILRGGAGKEYSSSLKKGGELLSLISLRLGDKYKPIDILIDKNHIWHCGGVPVAPGDLPSKIDIIWNTAHPSLSGMLSSLSIPHISTPAFSSALENSRSLLEEHMKKMDIAMPRSVILPVYQKDFDGTREKYSIKKAKEIFERFPSPWIVKSFTPDSNMGIHLAKTFPELVAAIEDGVNHGQSIVAEEFISGKIASVHSMPLFRGEAIYTFPLVNSFGAFSSAEKDKLASIARDLHKHIGAGHYLKSDFVLGSKGKIYLLQVETAPDLRDGSHFAEACAHVGAKIEDVVEHILEQAL